MTVKINPLRFEALSVNMYRAPAPLFGNIRVETYGDGKWLVQWSAPGISDAFLKQEFDHADQAILAAQIEYEKRILECVHEDSQ